MTDCGVVARWQAVRKSTAMANRKRRMVATVAERQEFSNVWKQCSVKIPKIGNRRVRKTGASAAGTGFFSRMLQCA
jgi:hypothetical protein